MIRTALTYGLFSAVLAAQITRTAPGESPRQARSPEEFDLYIAFDEARDPEVRHQKALQFEQDFPQSELLVYVYQSELEYARARNLYDATLAAGQKALALAPDDIPVLLALAEVIPNGTSGARAIALSETYANRVLQLSESRHVGTELSVDDCDYLRQKIRSRAHAALGLIAAKRGKVAVAVREFETAVAENPETDGVLLYRLARLYQVYGRQADAAALLQRAFQAGPAEIRALAKVELKRAR